MDDVINVMDYGALGDGVTDDTKAIQAALHMLCTCSFCVAYFPAGTFLVTQTLIING